MMTINGTNTSKYILIYIYYIFYVSTYQKITFLFFRLASLKIILSATNYFVTSIERFVFKTMVRLKNYWI